MKRQLTYLLACTLFAVLVLSITLPTVLGATYQSYPAMLPGKTTGSISGRVINSNNSGISGANVTVVNASNSSIFYKTIQADSGGYFCFTDVNSTNGGEAYRVLANASGYNDGYSVFVAVEPGNTCSVHTMTLSGNGPSPTTSPTPKPGSISGYIRQAGTNTAMSDAKVTLVNALDAFTTYGSTHTDSNGYYRITGVKVISSPGYRLHIEKDGYREEYSSPFLIFTDTESWVNLTIARAIVATSNAAPTNTTAPTITATPSAPPSASPTPRANTGMLAIPGFELIAALAGLITACIAARKR